jgi:hypothetical protein
VPCQGSGYWLAGIHLEGPAQMKDDFISLISHELQTPVFVVQGWATAIRKRQLHGEGLDVALNAIERNARVQSRLVQDLLDRSRIARGRLRLDLQIVSLSEILKAAVEQVRPTFDHNHVQLRTDIESTRCTMSAVSARRGLGLGLSIGVPQRAG